MKPKKLRNLIIVPPEDLSLEEAREIFKGSGIFRTKNFWAEENGVS